MNTKVQVGQSKHKGASKCRGARVTQGCFSIPTSCECKNFKQILLQQVGSECRTISGCPHHSNCIHIRAR